MTKLTPGVRCYTAKISSSRNFGGTARVLLLSKFKVIFSPHPTKKKGVIGHYEWPSKGDDYEGPKTVWRADEVIHGSPQTRI